MERLIKMNKIYTLLVLLSVLGLVACSPEVGSEKWCSQLDAKAKGDWTMNEVTDYTKHCLFK